jgi:M6 family metalloprotease-like protein
MKSIANKIFLCFLVALFTAGLISLSANNGHAVPAAPGTHTLRQADGTEFQARLWGDEWSHGWETLEGYSIVFDKQKKNWQYAARDNSGKLIPSSRIVRKDLPERTTPLHMRPSGKALEAILQKKSDQALKVVPPFASANIPVILINYSDRSTSHTDSEFNTLLFGTGNNSMKDFYEENSYGIFSVSAGPGGIVDWVTASNTHDYYGANDGIGNDLRPGHLVREAVIAADSSFNFAPYDQDSDCFVDVVNIIHQGSGEEAGGPATDIWSHRWDLNGAFSAGYSDGGQYTTNDSCPSGGNIIVNDYVIQPETFGGGLHTVGVFAHEYGHALGLPDLYDIDGTSEGIGYWSLMASGSWNAVSIPGDRPAHMDAWSKFFLDWVNPTAVSGTLTNESITEAASAADVYKLLNGTPNSGEYFLVENRQQTGFDAGLPGSGLLIWHIGGDTINSCTFFLNNVNTNECISPPCPSNHFGVTLVQADNNWDLENNTNRGDSGDPYASPAMFTAASSPDSDRHSGIPSGVTVTNISASAATMTADLSASPSAGTPLLDGGFEGGTPNSNWNECSINFGTPICDALSCGTGGGTGPRTDLWWAWFGGILGFTEVSSVDQDISIPGRSCADLSFYLEMPAANTTGYMNVAVDGRTFFTATDADIASYPVPYATPVTVDVSAFADNGIHNLLFETTTDASFGVLNFFVDDVAVTTTPKTFNDVPPGFWAENYISAIACNNITTGCGGSNYCPGGNVTRAEMAAFIIRALYGETFSFLTTPHFSDVPGGHWAFRYIQRMFEESITTGCTSSTYCPNNNVTRAQMAAFLTRAFLK